jgi:SAM-dependent methyltransferase
MNIPPAVEIEQFVRRIRAAVAKQGSNEPALCQPATPSFPSIPTENITAIPIAFLQDLPVPAPIALNLPEQDVIGVQPAFKPTAADMHGIKSLLAYEDRDFIRAAYWAVLRRVPDEGGLDTYLRLLRNGTPKVEILGFLRDSTEGQPLAVPVPGLWSREAILKASRWPLVGPIARRVIAFWRLPDMQRAQHVLVSRLISQQEQTQAGSREAMFMINRALHDLENGNRQLLAYTVTKPGQNAIDQIEEKLHNVKSAVEALRQLANTKANKEDTDRALGDLHGTLEAQRSVKADAREVEQITTYLNDLLALVRNTQSQKADKSSVEAALHEFTRFLETKADQSNLDEALRLLMRALEAKAERLEITALTNHFINLLKDRLTKADILSLEQSVDSAIKQANSDRATQEAFNGEVKTSLEAARMDARINLENSLHDVNQALESLTQSKVDCTLLDDVRAEVTETFHFSLNALNQTITALSQEKADRTAIEVASGELKVSLEIALRQAEENLRNALAPVTAQAGDFKQNLLDQERRVRSLLEEARKRLPKPISTSQIEAMLTEEDHLFDAMYAGLEDIFRGAWADIKERQSVYLPYIRDANAGDPSSPIVDLGCGRGEWLQLLRESGLNAEGVDINRVFLRRCRDLNLNVVENDAVTYLRGLKPNSLGAITSFHLIEHIPHRSLIALLDAALPALQPGGIAIFETPNPRNVQVGSCNFYLDPTHRHPLPPDLMRYLLEARGFERVVIKELHPCSPENLLVGGSPIVTDTLNRFFFSAQDYAVIGRKP